MRYTLSRLRDQAGVIRAFQVVDDLGMVHATLTFDPMVLLKHQDMAAAFVRSAVQSSKNEVESCTGETERGPGSEGGGR